MDILDKFIQQAKENLADGYYADMGHVSLKQKLASQPFSLITEIKHASPAGAYSFDYIDVRKAADTFKASGADAISVVVEPKIFKGSLLHVLLAKKSGLPVLFKDFIFTEQQIKAAAAHNADCILLIMKLADRLSLDIDDLIGLAHQHGLEVLLECYDADEMQRALATDADILGINNRDLQTLQVDIQRTKLIMDSLPPQNLTKPVISESGVKTRGDAEFLKAAGVKGILVGTALWTARDLAGKVKELRI